MTCHAPPLPVCGLLIATGTAECTRALRATVRGCNDCARDRLAVARPVVTSSYRSCDCSPLSSDRSRSGKRSWRPGWSLRDCKEAVVTSRNHGNSGSMVESAPAVAGGSIPLPTSSFPDLVRLFLSLSGPVEQRDATIGSLLSAASVTGAGVLPDPATPVTSAAPVACSSAMPAPVVSTSASAASATASPGRCERARESSRPERRSSGRERSRSGRKHGRGWSPSRARSARSASVSASSSSESLDPAERVSAMPPPSSGRSGVGGSRSRCDRSASGRDSSPQPGPSGLGSG